MARTLYQGVTDQSKAGRHRFVDVGVLFDGDRWRGSMYMAGYAVECLLKTTLMRMFQCHVLTDLEEELRRRNVLPAAATLFTHQLEFLVALTQSMPRLRQNAEAWAVFNTVNRWIPAWRYTADQASKEDAEDFLSAVGMFLNWVEHNV